MGLEPIATEDHKKIAALLADYWKERGMPEYDRQWAEAYLKEGHKTEIKTDEFFLAKEGNEIVGIISLITDVSGVAEVRDEVAFSQRRQGGHLQQMIAIVVDLAKKRKLRKVFSLALPALVPAYRRNGFAKEGVLKGHFREGEDLIIMSRFLV